jgi:hypothetical protein
VACRRRGSVSDGEEPRRDPDVRPILGDQAPLVLFRKFFRVKLRPSANNPRVVGGAKIQMREDAAEQYLAYKLMDSNQDWKSK